MSRKFNFRDYQQTSIEKAVHVALIEKKNPLVVGPPACGKGYVVAGCCQAILRADRKARILVLSHLREILHQDRQKLAEVWPGALVSFACKGLNSRLADFSAPIVLGSIQTVHAAIKAHVEGNAKNKFLGQRLAGITILLVDEAHMISRDDTSRYQEVRRMLEQLTGRIIPIIGFTATPFRLDSGHLTEGGDAPFDCIAHETPVIPLIKQRLVSLLTNCPTSTRIDVSKIGVANGDFIEAELDRKISEGDVTRRAVREIVALGAGRKSWIVFGVTIRHCLEIADRLRESGIRAEVIDHRLDGADREAMLKDFRTGKIQALVSVTLMTAGIDVGPIDLVAILRPTMSTSLVIQMMGRGMRVAPGKTNCLILDFGGNIERHGPINNPTIHVKQPSSALLAISGAGLTKKCPECEHEMNIRSRMCAECGHLFSEIGPQADLISPIFNMDESDHTPIIVREVEAAIDSVLALSALGKISANAHLAALAKNATETLKQIQHQIGHPA